MRVVSRLFAIAFLSALAVMLASASASLPAAAEDAPGEALRRIVTADFNRDGLPDIAEIISPAGDSSGSSVLRVSLGQVNGTIQSEPTAIDLGNDPQAIVAGDFNGDGIPDLIVGGGDGALVELLGDGTGKFVSVGEIARVGSVTSIAVADFNHDGKLDFAISDSQDSVITVFAGIPSADGLPAESDRTAVSVGKGGSFRQLWSFSLPTRGKVFHLAAADFNGDGLPDLAVTNDDDPSYQVMLNNGNGTFTYAPQLSKVVDPNAHCAT